MFCWCGWVRAGVRTVPGDGAELQEVAAPLQGQRRVGPFSLH